MTDKLADALRADIKYLRNQIGGHTGPTTGAIVRVCSALEKSLTAQEAAKAAAPDDVRRAFEIAYGASWGSSDFATFDGTMYHLPDNEDTEDPKEYHKELNQDWIAFKKGFTAALRQPQGVPREVVDALQEERKDASRIITNHKAMNIRADYWEGFNHAIDKALALLNAQGVK